MSPPWLQKVGTTKSSMLLTLYSRNVIILSMDSIDTYDFIYIAKYTLLLSYLSLVQENKYA